MMKTYLYGILLMVVMSACSASFADVIDLGASTTPAYDTATLINVDPLLVPAAIVPNGPASGADWRVSDTNFYTENINLACSPKITQADREGTDIDSADKVPIAI